LRWLAEGNEMGDEELRKRLTKIGEVDGIWRYDTTRHEKSLACRHTALR
jgi:hypothetical protein